MSHPIGVRPPQTLEDRVTHLEAKLAQLWDQVWWIQLSSVERGRYESEGFSAPIQQFYD